VQQPSGNKPLHTRHQVDGHLQDAREAAKAALLCQPLHHHHVSRCPFLRHLPAGNSHDLLAEQLLLFRRSCAPPRESDRQLSASHVKHSTPQFRVRPLWSGLDGARCIRTARAGTRRHGGISAIKAYASGSRARGSASGTVIAPSARPRN